MLRRLCAAAAAVLLLAGCGGNAENSQPTEPKTFAPAATTVPETLPPDPEEEYLAGMTLEEKIGQLFLLRFPGEKAAEAVETYGVGGLCPVFSGYSGAYPGIPPGHAGELSAGDPPALCCG